MGTVYLLMSNQYVSIDPCNFWVGLSGIIIDPKAIVREYCRAISC